MEVEEPRFSPVASAPARELRAEALSEPLSGHTLEGIWEPPQLFRREQRLRGSTLQGSPARLGRRGRRLRLKPALTGQRAGPGQLPAPPPRAAQSAHAPGRALSFGTTLRAHF